MWNVLLCFKNSFCTTPRFRCCLWIPPPTPQGVLLAIIPSWSKLTWVLKCCSVHHYEKAVSVSYSHLNHAISVPKQGNGCSERRQPLEHHGARLEFWLFPTWSQQLRDVLGAAPPWHKQLLQTLGKTFLLLGIDIWTSHWQNKQNLSFWIQLPSSPLGKYKLKLILTVLNNSTYTLTAASLPPTMRNAV